VPIPKIRGLELRLALQLGFGLGLGKDYYPYFSSMWVDVSRNWNLGSLSQIASIRQDANSQDQVELQVC
jgi:hypothetical protein